MNQRKAKALRKLVGFNPNEEREYVPAKVLDFNGVETESPLGKEVIGKRKDYQLLKAYLKGKSVILPKYLQDLL